MGVKGLWRLLLPIGRRISLETLEGQILAVDASIWMTQFLKAMRDSTTGKVAPAAHLQGLLRRLCRLHFYGIRAVLVLDGPTPALKLRELNDRRKRRDDWFAQHDQAALQRLAKRLLAEQLQKHKQQQQKSSASNKERTTPTNTSTTSNGPSAAFAEDFDPGGNHSHHDNDGSGVNGVESTTRSTAKSDSRTSTTTSPSPEQQPEQPPQTSAEDEAAILAAIQEDLVVEQNTQEIQQRERNDFDAPFDGGSSCESEEEPTKQRTRQQQQQQHGTTHSNPPMGAPKSRRRRQNRGRRGKKTFTEYGLEVEEDVSRISSLPHTDRKDAIEQVKRQQRLQSRQEYMPAAASPDQFSLVQLQNFLKSSQFNLDIARMATMAAASNNTGSSMDPQSQGKPEQAPHSIGLSPINHGTGHSGLMASDRTVHISLIREADEGTNNSSNNAHSIRGRGGATSRTTSRNNPQSLIHQASKNDSNISPPHTKQESKSMAKDQDSSSSTSDEEVEWQDVPEDSSHAPPENGNNGLAIPSKKATDTNSGSHPSSHDEEGEEEEATANKTVLVPSRHRTVLEIQDDDDSSHESSNSRNVGGYLSGPRPDHRNEQERQDHALAKALQEMEDSNAAQQEQFAQDSASIDPNEKKESTNETAVGANSMQLLTSDKDSRNGKEEDDDDDDDRKPAAKPDIVNVEDSSNSEDDSNIDWQDGDAKGLAEENETESIDWQDGDANVPAENETKDTLIATHPTTNDETRAMKKAVDTSAPQLLELTDSTSRPVEESALSGNKDLAPSRELFNSESTGVSSQSSLGLSQVMHRPESSNSPVLENDFGDPDVNVFGGRGENGGGESGGGTSPEEKERQSLERQAVLQRAQATASSLADWAGRAFRRAVKEIGVSEGDTEPQSKRDEPAGMTDDVGAMELDGAESEDDPIEVLFTKSHPKAPPQSKKSNEPPKDSRSSATRMSRDDQYAFLADFTSTDKTELSDDLLRQWESERIQREQDVDTVTDEMKQEVMQLLRLFGVPYIEAPAEAEAQCAALEALGLVDGIVTEDSDVFVFGGKKVYKNVFEEKHYAEAYMANDAEKEMDLNRNGLVALALLLGSDYT